MEGEEWGLGGGVFVSMPSNQKLVCGSAYHFNSFNVQV